MPLLNRFERPPRAWPPPASPEEIGDALEYPRRRDPVGDGVHAALAGVTAFLVNISTAAASVGMALLVGYTVLRLPNAWRGLTPLFRSPVIAAWLAWFGWAALSGFWTPNLLDWADSLGGFPAVLLFPSLFLVSGRWRWILGAFVAGAATQGMAQAIQASVPAWRPPWQPRFDGLATHPGHVATVSAMALVLALAWLHEERGPRSHRWLFGAAVACLGSVALGAGRGAMAGLAVGAAVLFLSLAGRRWSGPRGRLAGMAALALVAIGIGLSAIGIGPASLTHAVRDTSLSTPDNSIAQRILWWQASWDAFRAHPWVGLGTGGTATWFDVSPRIAEHAAGVPGRDRAFFTAPHPHSIPFLTLAEQGIPGLCLMLAVLWTTFRGAWRSTAVRPIGCGLLAAITVWWVAGCFDSINLPARLVAPLVLVSTFASLPRGRGAGLDPAD